MKNEMRRSKKERNWVEIQCVECGLWMGGETEKACLWNFETHLRAKHKDHNQEMKGGKN